MLSCLLAYILYLIPYTLHLTSYTSHRLASVDWLRKFTHKPDRILNTVEMRAVNDKEIGAGSSTTRNIYSPRLTSPNQFMHFGKRLPEPVTTKLMPPARVYDLHRREQLQQPLETSSFPFLFSIELERGQTLSALPEGQ